MLYSLCWRPCPGRHPSAPAPSRSGRSSSRHGIAGAVTTAPPRPSGAATSDGAAPRLPGRSENSPGIDAWSGTLSETHCITLRIRPKIAFKANRESGYHHGRQASGATKNPRKSVGNQNFRVTVQYRHLDFVFISPQHIVALK